MKRKITYYADENLRHIIGLWTTHLKDEHGYSEHTVDAYARDLSFFLSFFLSSVLPVNSGFSFPESSPG